MDSESLARLLAESLERHSQGLTVRVDDDPENTLVDFLWVDVGAVDLLAVAADMLAAMKGGL